MTKSRIEAFSDGVMAIIITIMVLELKTPHGSGIEALQPLLPVLLSYVLSFVFVGIYWNNHHHLFQAVKHVRGWTLWANLHLLFWLSLIPFVTAWMGENFAPLPVSMYGAVLLGCGFAYSLLVRSLLKHHGKESPLAQAIGGDTKGNISLGCYIAAIPLAYLHPAVSAVLFIVVALIWVRPDMRIERALTD